MYKPKYPKTNLRNLKYNNPNPRDLDQRERKSSEGEKELTSPARPGARAAWLAHSGGLTGSCMVV